MNHAMQGHPRQMVSTLEFWHNVVHWRKAWQTTLVFLLWEPHELCKKPNVHQFISLAQSCLTLATTWTAACQASLSITNSWSLLKLMSIELVMPSNHLILCHPLLLLPSVFPSFRVLFQWVSSSHQVAKVLEFQLQHQSFQWIFRTDFPWDWLVGKCS